MVAEHDVGVLGPVGALAIAAEAERDVVGRDGRVRHPGGSERGDGAVVAGQRRARLRIELEPREARQRRENASRLGGLRLLPGRFMVIEQAMGLPTSRGGAAANVLAAFVDRAKASGFVARALERHGIQGAIVAPPA